MQNETRPIPGFSGYYATSSGQILKERPPHHIDRSLFLVKPTKHTHGYPYANIHCDHCGTTKPVQVHRLVALAFHGPPPTPTSVVRHLDGIKTNNASDNLRWGTRKENEADKLLHGKTPLGERHWKSVLTEKLVISIRMMSAAGKGLTAIAKQLGLAKSTVYNVLKGRTWKHFKGGKDE
jgi:DNA-binding phage protein